MSTDGFQITIPGMRNFRIIISFLTRFFLDFDEEEYAVTPNPFGRTGGHGFGTFGSGSGNGVFGGHTPGPFGGNGFTSGQDSPTIMTPTAPSGDRADRSYFHTRGDSITSDDSTHSTSRYVYGSKPSIPFAHSSQSSIAVTSPPPFTKKPSFASIRNAFKISAKSSSTQTNEAPPVPQLDHQAYPVLKNPFNRSTSSLAHPMPGRRPSTPAQTNSPQLRPATPSSDQRTGGRTLTKTKHHTYGRSQQSFSGSIFHNSDNGSDMGNNAPTTPPPVPRVPNGLFGQTRSETPTEMEEKVEIDPKTPSDYALHAVFTRFVAAAEARIESFLRYGMDDEPELPDLMGPQVDPKFEAILKSLGQIAQKHAKPVVNSVLRWRHSQSDSISNDIMRPHLLQSPQSIRTGKGVDIRTVLVERKTLTSIYLMCRALIAVMQSISKDALGPSLGAQLEEITFEPFRNPDLKLLAQSMNHRHNAELYAVLLGAVANIR